MVATIPDDRTQTEIRVRVELIGHARIRYVGKYQSCMVINGPFLQLHTVLSEPATSAKLFRAWDASDPNEEGLIPLASFRTGACTINRPCAQQCVGKSQSCMVISGRLIVHAPVQI